MEETQKSGAWKLIAIMLSITLFLFLVPIQALAELSEEVRAASVATSDDDNGGKDKKESVAVAPSDDDEKKSEEKSDDSSKAEEKESSKADESKEESKGSEEADEKDSDKSDTSDKADSSDTSEKKEEAGESGDESSKKEADEDGSESTDEGTEGEAADATADQSAEDAAEQGAEQPMLATATDTQMFDDSSSITYPNATSYSNQTFKVQWNDNHNDWGKRPSASEWAGNYVELQFQIGNGTWTTLSASTCAQIGIAQEDYDSYKLDFSNSEDQSGYFSQTINLPSKVVQTEKGTAQSITYRLVPTNTPSSYTEPTTTDSSNKTVTFTQETDYTAVVEWKDNGDALSYRPSTSDWKDMVTVKRYVAGKSPSSADTVSVTDENLKISTDGNTWTVSLEGLPNYNSAGVEYVYYIVQNGNEDIAITDEDWYEPKLRNAGNYSDFKNGLFSSHITHGSDGSETVTEESTLLNTLSGVIEYQVEKTWTDNNNPNRPTTVKMVMWRVADLAGATLDDSVPVQGYDSATVPAKFGEDKDQDTGTIDKTNFGATASLPKYSNEGVLYLYYTDEKSLPSPYVAEVTNPSDVLENIVSDSLKSAFTNGSHALNNGKVNNKLAGYTTPSVTKTFVAESMQSMANTSATFRLQMKTEGGEWAWYDADGKGAAEELTISGFSAEVMEISADPKNEDGSTKSYPVYDETGKKLEYRWVETSLTVNNGEAVNCTPASPFAEELDYSKVDTGVVGPSYSGNSTGSTSAWFQPTQTSSNHVTNTLVGPMNIHVQKTWNYNGTVCTTNENGILVDAATGEPILHEGEQVDMSKT